MSDASPPRRPLHEKSNSQSNAQAIRLVPSTPPQLLGRTAESSLSTTTTSPTTWESSTTVVRPTFVLDEIYSRTPLPTHPSHILGPGRGKTRGPYNLTSPVLDDSFHPPPTPQPAPQSTGPSEPSRRSPLQPAHDAFRATGSPSSKPRAPAKKRLQIHKDGRTFSLLRDDAQQAVVDVLPTSPVSSVTSPASRISLDSIPSYASNTEPRLSEISASFVADEDSTLTTIPSTPPPSDHSKSPADPLDTSPWNYSLVGGVRKVPKTPEQTQHPSVGLESPPPPLPPLPPVPEASDSRVPPVPQDLSTKQSFQSTNTVSTVSENSNYKLYRNNSTPSSAGQPSSEANYEILQESASESSVIYRPQPSLSDGEEWEQPDFSRSSSVVVRRPQTSDSEANYQLHGDPSPSASFLDVVLPSHYSQESLVVPALKPKAKASNERLGYYKSRSRESLRSRTGSLTSITTVLSQREALKAIVGSGFLVNLPPLPNKGPNSWAEPQHNFPQRSYMNEHPHQWSSQLSTVLSVSDGGSGRNSRSWSDATGGRSRAASRNSRALYSVGSSSFAQEDLRSRIDWPETPLATHTRRHLSTSSTPIIEDQDEYGDGITGLQDLRARPSRTRLSGYYNAGTMDSGRTNTMRSTSSSRSNSLLANSLPAWAKLYYGGGGGRYLGAPGSSTEDSDSRSNSFRSRSRSPNTDHFPLSLYSPRRRPRDTGPHPGRRVATGSMEITPLPDQGYGDRIIEDRRRDRFRTWSMSSVWSPHLRVDRRAIRQSVWEPPSVSWSTEGGYFGRRNVQILMFIAGFIFPFAWMIGAVLPLPRRPLKEMEERDSSTSNLGVSNDNFNDYERHFGPIDEARYESAKWWRGLNRWLSLVGALIIAAIIILVVVSLREGW